MLAAMLRDAIEKAGPRLEIEERRKKKEVCI
jgi:hypothetical protein